MSKKKKPSLMDRINGRPLEQYPHDIILWFCWGALILIVIAVLTGPRP